MKNDKIVIANKKFNSRLIVGTGKYKSMSECAMAIKLSGAEIVTVAVRSFTSFSCFSSLKFSFTVHFLFNTR